MESFAKTGVARRIRVGIADDHPITRRALRAYLGTHDDMEVVGEAGSGREALALVREHPLDVLLLDVDMPGQSGIDALPALRARARGGKFGVLVFSGYPEEVYAVPLLRAGASGYLGKGCEPAVIARAIRRIADGGRYITPKVAQQLLTQAVADEPAGPREGLSTRELQMLLKFAQGCTARDVARQLSLSSKTVHGYRLRLLRRFGMRSSSELTYYAVKEGLLA